MFAVTVLFEIRAEQRQRFLTETMANAARSLDVETGCQRFDVCSNPGDHGPILLYELYRDRAAFDAHLHSEHFRRFDAAVAGMVISKQLATYEEVGP